MISANPGLSFLAGIILGICLMALFGLAFWARYNIKNAPMCDHYCKTCDSYLGFTPQGVFYKVSADNDRYLYRHEPCYDCQQLKKEGAEVYGGTSSEPKAL